MSRLHPLPMTLSTWNLFAEFFTKRGLGVPSYPEVCLLVGTFEPLELVAGACMYPTKGAFVVLEHLAVSPTASGAMKLAAVERLATMANHTAHALGKHVLVQARGKGLQHVLLRAGYVFAPARAMFCRTGDTVVLKKTPPPTGGQTAVAFTHEHKRQDTKSVAAKKKRRKRRRRAKPAQRGEP